MKDNVSAFHSVEYDDGIKRTIPYYEELYRQVIEIVKTYKTNSLAWLDAGCGTGKMAEAVFQTSEQVNIEKFVFCDSSAGMIEFAKKRFKNAAAKTEFHVLAVQDIEFTDAFDVITAIQVNHFLHKEERQRAISKCCQALKENGMFISFENIAPFSELGKQLYLERWKTYQIEQGKDLAEAKKHIGRYNTEYFPINLEEHLHLLESSGFRTVEVLWLSYMQAGFLAIR